MFSFIYFIVYPNYLKNTRPERPKYDKRPIYNILRWTLVRLMCVRHSSLTSSQDAQNNYRTIMEVRCFKQHPP